MTARGRPRKGLKRIDAAVDALGQLGFSRDVVCKTVNNLLKVYDGDAGWPFIEEASYKLVIETILEEQENEGKEDEEETRNDGRALEVCDQVNGDGEASSQLQALAGTPYAERSINWKDISCMDHGSRNSLPGQCQHASTLGEVGRASNASSAIASSHSHQPLIPSRPIRKPCYGWISEDEDGEEDPPRNAHVTADSPNTTGSLRRERKRKSGWDVKPWGM